MKDAEMQAEIEKLRGENAVLKRKAKLGFFAFLFAWIRYGLLVVGPVFVIIAGSTTIHNVVFIHSSIATSGTVLQMYSRTDSSNGSVNYVPQYSFTTSDGKSYTVTSTMGTNPPAYTVGEHVQVRYKADNPADAMIASFVDLWLFPLTFGVMGLVASGIGAFLQIRYRKSLHSE